MKRFAILVTLLALAGCGSDDRAEDNHHLTAEPICTPWRNGSDLLRVKDEEAGCWVYIYTRSIATFPIKDAK